MSSKTIYIVRHGETEYNRLGIVQGSGVDSVLNDKGIMQAQAFFQRYQQVPFEAVLTSKLQRTQQTVRSFIDLGIPWESFAEINELNWGIHEGKKGTPAMIEEYQLVREQWGLGHYDARIEGGESATELADRLKRFVNHLRQRPENCLLVCSHGRAMSGLMSILKKEQLKEMNKYKHDNTGLWKTDYCQNLFRFELENDTSHLGG